MVDGDAAVARSRALCIASTALLVLASMSIVVWFSLVEILLVDQESS